MRAKLLVVCILATSSLQAGYSYQASVSMPPAINTDQTNISLTVTGLDARMRTQANGGFIRNTVTRVGQTVPADFVLSSTACVAPTLYAGWGWDFYDATTGSVKLWLLMPLHSSTVSTTVFMCYGNVAVSTYQGGVQGSEFDANTKGVFHLSNGTVLSANDYSSSANNGTLVNTPTAAVGQIDGAGNFVATSSQYLNGTGINITSSAFTLSAWIKPSSLPTGTDRQVFSVGSVAGTRQSAQMIETSDTSLIFGLFGDDFTITGLSSLLNVWTNVVMVFSNSNVQTIYVNGASRGTRTAGGAFTGNTNWSIGRLATGTNPNYFDGSIDEVSATNVARSADWIATQYANQNSPPVIGASIALVAAGAINNPM